MVSSHAIVQWILSAVSVLSVHHFCIEFLVNETKFLELETSAYLHRKLICYNFGLFIVPNACFGKAYSCRTRRKARGRGEVWQNAKLFGCFSLCESSRQWGDKDPGARTVTWCPRASPGVVEGRVPEGVCRDERGWGGDWEAKSSDCKQGMYVTLCVCLGCVIIPQTLTLFCDTRCGSWE